MKNFKILLILIVCIVMLSGCSAGTVSKGNEPLPSDNGAKDLTIEVDSTGSFYQDAAKKFEKATGVKVNVINHYNPTQNVDDQDYAYMDRIPGELMAGKGADIYADIYLDFTAMGKQGHLCNLKDWIAQDPDFTDAKYYMNIWIAGFNTGDLYSFPLSLVFTALGSEVEIPELEGKNLTWEEFFDTTKGINRNGVLIGLSDLQIFRSRFEDRYAEFIDEANKTDHLNTPEMVKLLKQCKEWSGQGLCIPNNADNFEDVFKNAFIIEYGSGINVLTNIRAKDSMSGDNPYWYDIPTDSGKNDKANKLLPADYICINAASHGKGTAWKFIKFLLSKDIQATNYSTPINREAAKDYITNFMTTCVGYSKDSKDAELAIQQTQAILDAIKEIPGEHNQKGIEKDVIAREAKRFFNNETSAEDTAKNMADAAKLYMKEQ